MSKGKRVSEMTPEAASGLDTRELVLLLKDYYSALKTVTGIVKMTDIESEQAKKNYDEAVNNILSGIHDYGMSRMASVRLAENIIKLKLCSDGKEYENNQGLSD